MREGGRKEKECGMEGGREEMRESKRMDGGEEGREEERERRVRWESLTIFQSCCCEMARPISMPKAIPHE